MWIAPKTVYGEAGLAGWPAQPGAVVAGAVIKSEAGKFINLQSTQAHRAILGIPPRNRSAMTTPKAVLLVRSCLFVNVDMINLLFTSCSHISE